MPEHRRIDFLVIGTQKAGTTTLDAFLRQHRGVEMATVKEVHFFDRDFIVPRGRMRLGGQPSLRDFVAIAFDDPVATKALYDQYHMNWSWSRPVARGEATPSYLFLPQAIDRIRKYSTDVRLICCLRNPYDRAWSQWRMSYSNGTEPLDFIAAVKQELSLPTGSRCLLRSYVNRGRYGSQVARLLESFSREQCLFIKFDDLVESPDAVAARVCEFLAIDRTPMPIGLRMKVGVARGGMPASAFELLAPEFEPELRQLEELLGWNCPEWSTPTLDRRSPGVYGRVMSRIRRARVVLGQARRLIFGPADPESYLNRWQV